MSEKEKQTNLLCKINNQFKELIDLIEKEKNYSFSIKSLEKKKKSKKKWFIIAFVLLLLSISICLILLNDQLPYNIYFVFLSFIRLILIKILPYWDWTTIYTNSCLIANPFYNNSLDITECNKCANTTEVVRQSNMTFFNFTKNIYLNHLPVIIDDATQTWPAMKELTVKSLFELFIEDPVLSENDLCFFEANIRNYNQPGGADKLFNDYLDKKRRSFVANWNNCKRETFKILRAYYHKPYFLPPSVGQTLMGNWFLVSAGYDKVTRHFHRIPLNHNWIWIAQIQGSSLIELQPKQPCDTTCSILESIKLDTGDLIIYSRLYDALYRPLDRETILLAQGVD